MAEKILASHAIEGDVRPGAIVVTKIDCAVPVDLNFYDSFWYEPTTVFDPERVVIIFDHIVPPPNRQAAEALDRGREFARRMAITQLHDVGGEQGICHQIIAEVPYAKPGEILVCTDSHTCSAGALNCAARGIGAPELTYVLATGQTWFQVGTTVRYQIEGRLPAGATAKDVFLYLATQYGDHVGRNLEFGGDGLATLSIDARRTITTMAAELSAEFAICEPDAVLEAFLAERGESIDGAVRPDPDASYEEVRTIDLAGIEPMVSRPHTVIHNAAPVSELAGKRINRAFIGSCSNGTLDDLRQAADVLAGQRVHPDVTLIVTPASQAIYRTALHEGLIETLTDAGALVTTSSCGMCAGFVGALGAGDVCIASSTRNFRGRMGSPAAEIYLASSATVAASAVAGAIEGATIRSELPTAETIR